MMNIKCKLWLLLVIFVFTAFSASAQDKSGFSDDLAREYFYIDYAAFYDTSTNDITLEVYYKIFPSVLTFEKRGEKYKASYNVDIVISKKGKQYNGTSLTGDLLNDTYESTLSTEDYILNKVMFKLPPDNYKLEGHLTDKYSKDKHKRNVDLKLKRFDNDFPMVSNFEFIKEIDYSDSASSYAKAGKTLIPSVSRFFGYSQPELIFYYQIYNNSDFTGDYNVHYQILSRNKEVLSDNTLFPNEGIITERIEQINIEQLLPGVYALKAEIKSPGNKLKLVYETNFKIEWSAVSIVINDYETAVDQLKFIASQDQIKYMKKVDPDLRLATWNEFWKARDRSPQTPENEIKNEYYRRLRYADVNYGVFGRNGWKSDFGMVYITYGPPSEIERHPFDRDRKPFQIWYYYERKLRFLFIDHNGYGEYELQYPYDGDIRKLR
jgi:GWxTD domain-containing protein